MESDDRLQVLRFPHQQGIAQVLSPLLAQLLPLNAGVVCLEVRRHFGKCGAGETANLAEDLLLMQPTRNLVEQAHLLLYDTGESNL